MANHRSSPMKPMIWMWMRYAHSDAHSGAICFFWKKKKAYVFFRWNLHFPPLFLTKNDYHQSNSNENFSSHKSRDVNGFRRMGNELETHASLRQSFVIGVYHLGALFTAHILMTDLKTSMCHTWRPSLGTTLQLKFRNCPHPERHRYHQL